MSTNSGIEWTEATWNPVVGCEMVSPGCAHCYAETMANRLAGMARKDRRCGKNPGRKSHYLNVINDKGRWAGNVVTVPEALPDPFGWKKPRRVFVNSMSDLFHKDVANEFVAAVFGVMAACPQHTFQILTKRAERLPQWFEWVADEFADSQRAIACAPNVVRACLDAALTYGGAHLKPRLDAAWEANESGGWPLPNVWLGTSVENQEQADKRIPHLLRCPAAVRFISAEPLLGRLDLHWHGVLSMEHECTFDNSGKRLYASGTPMLDWVIVGGESGPGARECHTGCIEEIVDQCQRAGVPVFVKQLGSVPRQDGALKSFPMKLKDKKGGDPDEWPSHLRVRQFPQLTEAR